MIRLLCVAALVACAWAGIAIATPHEKPGQWLDDKPRFDIRPLGFLVAALAVIAASFIP